MFQIAPDQTYSQEMERIAMDLFNSFVLVFLQFNILFVLLSKICTDDPPRVRNDPNYSQPSDSASVEVSSFGFEDDILMTWKY